LDSKKNIPGFTFDTDLEMKDAGLVAASAAAQVDSAAKVLDVGSARVTGTLVVDVSAIEIASNDERYEIYVEGANEEAMDTTLVPLASIQLGALEVLGAGSSHFLVDSTTGRYEVPFTNVRGGVVYQYIRVYTVVEGTIATGINFTAYIGK
ncbi:MAG: hypothetical protein B6I36_10315, partial [Desulfobacteraceae bacterium 4572_35.1]